MSSIDEFMVSCTQILNANIGHRSKRLIDKARSNKKLNDDSNISDFEEFIDLIELDVAVISGKNNAINICNSLRSKAIEFNFSKQAKDIYDAFRTETKELSITEFLRKINVADVCAFRARTMDTLDKQKPLEASINNKIEEFLLKHIIPTEGVINRYSTSLAYKFCEDAKKIKKDIIEKVKQRVKNELIRKAIRKEITNLITIYPQPSQTDIDDFVRHLHFSELKFHEDELRKQIANEILYGNFFKYEDIEDSTEFAQFLDIIITFDNKEDIIKELQKNGIIYLIEDMSGISDKQLDEYIELIIPIK